MALRIREVMNHEIFSVRPGDRADDALLTMLGMQVGAAPVVDERNHLLGIVSWRDLAPAEGDNTIAARMTRDADVVSPDERIEEAARRLAIRGVHHAPVVDEDGALVGFVSALDLVRGLLGVPARHPGLFPHVEPLTQVAWTDELLLDDAGIEAAPGGPGVIAFFEGGRGRVERLIAVEQANNIRARLLDVVSEGDARPMVARAIESGALRVRCAAVADAGERARVAGIVARHIADGWFEHIAHE